MAGEWLASGLRAAGERLAGGWRAAGERLTSGHAAGEQGLLPSSSYWRAAGVSDQIRAEKLKLSQSEAKAQEDKAKLLSDNATALSDEYNRGFKNAETLLNRIIDRMMATQGQ